MSSKKSQKKDLLGIIVELIMAKIFLTNSYLLFFYLSFHFLSFSFSFFNIVICFLISIFFFFNQKLYDSFKENELQLVEGLRFDDESYTFYHPEKRGKLLKLSSHSFAFFNFYFIFIFYQLIKPKNFIYRFKYDYLEYQILYSYKQLFILLFKRKCTLSFIYFIDFFKN